MASIGPWCQVVLSIGSGFLADKTGTRGLVVLGGIFTWWFFLLVNRLLIHSANGHARFAVLVLAWAFQGGVWHPVNGSWMALNARSSAERSITMAILIMSANSAGIIGSQLFQESDAPDYATGWTVISLLVSVALLAAIVANVQYRILNRMLGRIKSTVRY